MGTRGAIGFRHNEQDKVTYNHFDSYPDGIGVKVLEFCRTQLPRASQVDAIQLIDEDKPPTAEDRQKLARFCDLSVSSRSDTDWYCLTRNMQGDLAAYVEAGVMPDSNTFLADSLFCEWAYIVNLDSGKLECYKGFNKNPHAPGRYAHLVDGDYNGVALISEYQLTDLPDPDTFVRQLNPPED